MQSISGRRCLQLSKRILNFIARVAMEYPGPEGEGLADFIVELIEH